jgi:hypothetical protein
MKKFGIVSALGVSSLLVVAALAFASGNKDSDDLMFEAAQKRLQLKGLELAGKDATKKVSWEEKALLKKTYIAVFTDILVQESLRKQPLLLGAAKERVLKREPKLYQITTASESGEQTYVVLARSANACSAAPQVLHVNSVEMIAKLLCLDPVLDDMSFATLGAKLSIETLPLAGVESRSDVGAYYDQLVDRELEALVTADFLSVYTKTGKVSLL